VVFAGHQGLILAGTKRPLSKTPKAFSAIAPRAPFPALEPTLPPVMIIAQPNVSGEVSLITVDVAQLIPTTDLEELTAVVFVPLPLTHPILTKTFVEFALVTTNP